MITITGLSHRFGTKEVLKSINLQVDAGQVVAIMGSSGGGKTTLLRCIAGLIRPTEGSVIVDGRSVLNEPEEARRRMGMVFQSSALFDYLTVEENVLFGPRRWFALSRADANTLAEESLRRVGLVDTRKLYPSELSGGMRKRVGIARALALKPKVILYDEPTTGLDPVTTYAIDQLIVDLRQEVGVTSLIVSHDVSSVFRVADKVAFLDQGELIYDGDLAGFERTHLGPIEEILAKASSKTLK